MISSANIARPSCVAVVRGEERRQRFQVRLLAAVQRGQRMHERFVLEQLVAVVLEKCRRRAQADARRRPRRPWRSAPDRVSTRTTAGAEERIELLLQLVLQLLGRNRKPCSRRAARQLLNSSASAMKCRAASTLVRLAPGTRSLGRPNRRAECSLICGVPTASSNSVAMRQDCAVRRMYSPSG